MNAPVVQFRSKTTPYAVVTPLNYAMSTLGGGYLPLPGGENSDLTYFRIYNNYGASTGVASMNNVSVTVFDGPSAASHTYATSVAAQSWVRIYQTGFGENSIPPGVYTQYVGEDTAIGRSRLDEYVPSYGSDGALAQTNTTSPRIRAGTDTNGVGFIEFASYVEAPDTVGFAQYSFAVSIIYDWVS